MRDRAQDGKSPAPLADVEIGEILAGKYRIEGLLGRGGMGTVWLATHLALGARVAVKVMSRKMADNAEIRIRFEREARASAKIKSRFVARVYDTGALPDHRPYLVMEYMEGETLAQALKRTTSMSLADTVRILGQVGRGLARAHELGNVHRDIKPDNVFLAHTSDDGEIAKVFDFGIVKTDAFSPDDGETQEGALLGTPSYMSPEQVDGRPVDFRSDIYSLGVVAFRMLTGKRLFAHEALSQVLMSICNAPLPSLLEYVPDLPPAVDAWFQRTCAREKEDRFDSAMACVDALAVAAGIAPVREVSIPVLAPAVSAGSLTVTGPPADTASGVSSPGDPTMGSSSVPARMDGDVVAALPQSRTKAVVIGAVAGIALALGLVAFARSGHGPGGDAAAVEATAHAVVAPAPAAPAAVPAPIDSTTLPAPTASTSTSEPLMQPDAGAARPSPRSAPGTHHAPGRVGGEKKGDRSPADKGNDERIHDVGY